MTPELYAVLSVACLGAIIVFFLSLYQDYREESFRQHMFALRDSLFDEVLHERLNFDDPAYGMLRSAMNGLIRYAHKISFSYVFIVSKAAARNGADLQVFSKQFENEKKKLSQEQMEVVNRYYMDMNILVAQHLIFRSPLFVLMLPALLLLETKNIVLKIIEKWNLKTYLDKLDTIGLEYGESIRHQDHKKAALIS